MGKVWIPGGGGGADLDLVTATATDIRKGKVIIDQDGNPLTGEMIEKTSATYTPGTANQIIAANQYLKGAQTIKGDANLVASKIKKGVTIFGITGTWEGYVTSPLNLYNIGTWSNLQTPGYTLIDGFRATSDDDLFRLYASSSSTNYSSVRLNSAVDLTGYNYIKVRTIDSNTASYARLTLGVDTSSSKGSADSCSVHERVSGLAQGGYLILDISSLTGEHWVYLTYHYTGPGDFGSNYKAINKILLSKT